MGVVFRKIGVKIPSLQEIIPIFAVLMEVLWVFAWLFWISSWPVLGWAKPPMSFISYLALALFTEIISRLVLGKNWSLKWARPTVLIASLIFLVLLVRLNQGGGYSLWNIDWFKYAGSHLLAILTGLIFGVYFIWCSINISRYTLAFHNLYRKFIIGTIGFILLLIVWGLVGGGKDIWSAAGIFVISFFGVGLLALAIANLEKLRAELLRHKEDTNSFSRRWFSMLVSLILIILGIAVATGSIFSANIAGMVVHGLSVLGDWILIALSYILLPLGYIFEGIVYVVRLFMNWLGGKSTTITLNIPDFSDLQKQAEKRSPVHIPAVLILGLKWTFVALVIGLVIFLLARTILRYGEGKKEKGVEEEHESIWSWSLFKADLRVLVAWLFRWTRRRKKAAGEIIATPPMPVTQEKDTDKIFTVRQLYQALLWEGRQSGIPRQKSETPNEYSNKLGTRFETAKEEIEALTGAYVFERYGEIGAEPEKLARLNLVWRNLRHKLVGLQSGNS